MGGCMDSLHNSHLSLDLQAGKPCDGLGLQLALAWSTPVQGAKLTSIQSHEEPSSLLKASSANTKHGAAGQACGLSR